MITIYFINYSLMKCIWGFTWTKQVQWHHLSGSDIMCGRNTTSVNIMMNMWCTLEKVGLPRSNNKIIVIIICMLSRHFFFYINFRSTLFCKLNIIPHWAMAYFGFLFFFILWSPLLNLYTNKLSIKRFNSNILSLL